MWRLLCALLLCFSFSGASAAVPSVGGSVGMWTNCLSSQGSTAKIWVSYYGSDAAALSQACIAQYRVAYLAQTSYAYVLTFLGCSGNLVCDYNVKATKISTGTVTDLGSYRDIFTVATLPDAASCSSGVYDANVNSCVGGTASCISGTPKVLTELICLGVDTYVKDFEPDCKTKNFTKVLASEGCEYKMVEPWVKECWQSKSSGNMYCSFYFVADGYGAGSGAASRDTAVVSADSALSNKCITPGGCDAVADLPSIVPASDGTTGGTGITKCGGEGNPSCQGGLKSGTTGCGGSGQPVCVSSSSGSAGGSSGSSVCGGPDLPACAVANEATDKEIKKIGEFLTGGSSDPAGDPVPVKAIDLDPAGLDGGSTVANMLVWRLPAHRSQCPTGSFTVFGKTITLNSHCSMVDNLMVDFRNLMTAVFVLCAFFIVMKA